MPNWYLCKIKVDRNTEDGSVKKVTEPYLINAMSYTEAEARTAEHFENDTPDFQITNISKANYSDIIPAEEGEVWFKAKVSFMSIDENAGKEKKINQYMLIRAEDLVGAMENLKKELKNFTVPYDMHALTETTILDVIDYNNESETKDHTL